MTDNHMPHFYYAGLCPEDKTGRTQTTTCPQCPHAKVWLSNDDLYFLYRLTKVKFDLGFVSDEIQYMRLDAAKTFSKKHWDEGCKMCCIIQYCMFLQT